jgi:2-polyprenyl-3-methyl-5-hydroxy-6-metoxy-1,4-benzoquinol methylase
MNFNEFYRSCRLLYDSHSTHSDKYLNDHAARFYHTYMACERHLKPGARILSIGAGDAYIESILAKKLNVAVTIFEFPAMLDLQEAFYRGQGFAFTGVDIANYKAEDSAEKFDLILSSEVVEHNAEAPSCHIARFRAHLKKDGVFVITTPNFGSLRSLVKFALQWPVLEQPEFSFLPVCFENQRYHRREYMPVEITAALEKCNLRSERVDFSMNAQKKRLKDFIFLPFEAMIPRWRITQICSARAV